MSEAFVTLATNDTYCLGALVLGRSLRRGQTTRKLVIMISKDVSMGMRNALCGVFDEVVTVDVLDSRDTMNLELLTRPDLGVTFTKLHCWRLTQYKKAVFLDADTLALRNVDELFERCELSASPDAGWPDCFNSGVFVFEPSEDTYKKLLNAALVEGSFDGGDQGLLNLFFNDWATKDISRHLPFVYNVVSQAFYSYLPAFKRFGSDIRIAHFIGAVKPWHQPYDSASGQVKPLPGQGHDIDLLTKWWKIFIDDVQPLLRPTMFELAGALAQLHVSSTRSGPSTHSSGRHSGPTPATGRRRWELGQVDYMGEDSFENIQAAFNIQLGLDNAPVPPPKQPSRSPTGSTASSRSPTGSTDSQKTTKPKSILKHKTTKP